MRRCRNHIYESCSLVGAASVHLGVVVSSNERHAYWIDGRSLGVLSCQGVTDEDTVITGRICQLDTTVSVAIKVAVDYDRIENSSRSAARSQFDSLTMVLLSSTRLPGWPSRPSATKPRPSLSTCLPRWRVVNGSLDRTVFNRELYGVWGGLSEEDRQKNLSASQRLVDVCRSGPEVRARVPALWARSFISQQGCVARSLSASQV